MAYLKGSRVTGLSPKPLDVKGFTQSASEDLEGTYSQHEVLLADAFNVTDNVTISDNLILTKLSDDGEAITLTGNATTTRTISGSGSLEGSTFAQTPNSDMTGMTGVVGSAVTGGAGLSGMTSLGTVTTGTIGSGVIMPAGSVVQVQQMTQSRDARSATSVVEGNSGIGANITTTSTSWVATGLTKTMNIASGNKILMQCAIHDIYHSDSGQSVGFKFMVDDEEVYVITSHSSYLTTAASRATTAAGIFLSKGLSSGNHTVAIYWKVTSGTAGYINGHTTSQSESSLVLQEIQQ